MTRLEEKRNVKLVCVCVSEHYDGFGLQTKCRSTAFLRSLSLLIVVALED